jgi:TPP-dependent pyruvate/acetoin dehydrogenase alpha subunit
MIPVTTDLELIDPLKAPKFSMYQVLDSNGNFVPGAKVAPLSKETALKMYRTMVRIQAIDDVFYNAQVRL